jgi:hypothetical protein
VIWNLKNFEIDLLAAFTAGVIAPVVWNGRDGLHLKE